MHQQHALHIKIIPKCEILDFDKSLFSDGLFEIKSHVASEIMTNLHFTGHVTSKSKISNVRVSERTAI